MASVKQYNKAFFFRASWWQSLKDLAPAARAEVYDTLCRYVFEGVMPKPDASSVASVAASFIITEIKQDVAKYEEISEKRAAAGRRGAAVTNAAKTANAEFAAANFNGEKTDDSDENSTEKCDECGERSVKSSEKNVKKPLKKQQNAAKSANAANDGKEKEKEKESIVDKEIETKREKLEIFSFCKEKKRNILFQFSMTLLSEGRADALKEAEAAYDSNEATGWVTKTRKPNGYVLEQDYSANPLARLAGWKRKNPPTIIRAEAAVWADVCRALDAGVYDVAGLSPEAINEFEGLTTDDGGRDVKVRFRTKSAFAKLLDAARRDAAVRDTIYAEIRKHYPALAQLNFYSKSPF